MIMELDEFRQFIGPMAKEHTEAQILQLRREMYGLAKLLLDIYRFKQEEKKTKPPPNSDQI